jgi:hypothetical protein
MTAGYRARGKIWIRAWVQAVDLLDFARILPGFAWIPPGGFWYCRKVEGKEARGVGGEREKD